MSRLKYRFEVGEFHDLVKNDKTIVLLNEASDFIKSIATDKLTVRNYKTKKGRIVIRRKNKYRNVVVFQGISRNRKYEFK